MSLFASGGGKNVKGSSEDYVLMKYKLANDALGIALWDMDVVIDDPTSPLNQITWSQELRDLLGFSNENDFPNTIVALAERFHPDDSAMAFAAFAAHFNDHTGKTPYDIEYRLMHKNGEYRWFHGLGTTLRSSAGIPIRVAGAVRDIDEIKKNEAEKSEALNTMTSVLDALDAIVYVTDPATGEILFMNNSMRQHYGFEDDVAGHICYKVLQIGMDKRCDFCPCHKLDEEPDSVVVWEFKDVLTQHIYRKTDRYIKWPDGETVHLQHSVDITDLIQANERNKQMSEELKTALLETQDANHAKDEFMSRMSHEMLTPMNAITGMTQIIKMEGVPEKLREYHDEIEKSSRHLLRMIHGLLDLTGKNDGSFRLVETEFAFDRMFRGVLKGIGPDIVEKQQTLNSHIDRAIPATLIGDEKRLAQVISHLLSNAVKFTQEHGVISFSADVIDEGSSDSEGYGCETVTLKMEIKDNGKGIAEEQQKEIFSLFEQGEGHLTRKEGGVGLGLALSEHIVQLMGGNIWVESELGKGSTFAFTCKLEKG